MSNEQLAMSNGFYLLFWRESVMFRLVTLLIAFSSWQ